MTFSFRRICGTFILPLFSLPFATSAVANPMASDVQTERLEIGRFHARSLLTCAGKSPSPLAILIPGSGANGPEEMMPGSETADGNDASLFAAFARSFRSAGYHTLQLGKPGVETFTGWDQTRWFYDAELFRGLTWQNLLDNVNDAVSYALREKPCGATSVVLVGHSEGTMVASDVAAGNSAVKGVVLLGFVGRSYKSILEWQLFEREMELWLRPDVDADHDGILTRAEASAWPELQYPWSEGEESVTLDSLAVQIRAAPERRKFIETFAASPLVANGIWDRASLYPQIARLSVPVVAFTGSLDTQTPPREVEALGAACAEAGKKNCAIHIVPGLGHAFSRPRPPRSHPLIDATMGPVIPEFETVLTQGAAKLRESLPSP